MHVHSGSQCPVGTDAAARSAIGFALVDTDTLFEALYGMALLASEHRKTF